MNAAIRKIGDFDSNGLFAPSNPGAKKPATCFIMTQVNGRQVRSLRLARERLPLRRRRLVPHGDDHVTAFLAYTVIGVATGCIYALTASGLVVTYTTSGIFNFAHGAIGMLMAFTYWQLTRAAGLARSCSPCRRARR